MADDMIDIEEHNILDNPVIRRLFPDITVLKEEVLDSYDGGILQKHLVNNTPHQRTEMYPIIVIDETDMPSPCLQKELTKQDFHSEFSKKDLSQKNYVQENDTGLNVEVKINRHVKFETSAEDFVMKLKNIEEKNIESSSLISENVNDNINERISYESNIKSNPLGQPKVPKKTSVNYSSLNLVNNFPINRLQAGSATIPLTVRSTAQSNLDHDNKIVINKNITSGLEKSNDNLKESVLPWIGNKIFLGTKLRTSENCSNTCKQQNILSNVQILVENLEIFLNKSSRYCKKCLTLFPSTKSLADHKKLLHSQVNNNHPRNYNTKIKKVKKSRMVKKYNCNVCDVVISSLDNLLRHKKSMHSLNIKSRLRKATNNFKCTHCNNTFSSQQALIDHMYYVLQTKTKNAIKSSENMILNRKVICMKTRVLFRCPFCSYYFKQKNVYVKHIKKKHNNTIKIKLEKVVFDPRCKKCSTKYSSLQSYNAHTWKCYQKQIKLQVTKITKCKNVLKTHRTKKEQNSIKKMEGPYNKKKRSENKETNRTMSLLNLENKKSNTNSSDYEMRHVIKKEDNINNIIRKTQSQSNNNENYQRKFDIEHLIMNEQHTVNENVYILKSVFFKCTKCDVCFLSGKEAANHKEHADILRNWECSKCFHIFKPGDQVSHTQQHVFIDNFDIYEISENTFIYLLYKCTNCASYFREIDFFNHYSKCEIQPPDSAYCKTCHILIDSKIKESHEMLHKMMGSLELNNILVESDVIKLVEGTHNVKELFDVNNKELRKNYDESSSSDETPDGDLEQDRNKDLIKLFAQSDEYDGSEENDNKEDIGEEKILNNKHNTKRDSLRFIYCDICNCFIFVSKVRKLYHHVNGLCLNFTNYVCKHCGLVLSSKTIDSHRKLHQELPDLKLSDFKFNDLRGKKISPPLPKYPSCQLCKKHFITKTAIISHQCNKDYLECTLCKIKLSKAAFPLHMAFHNYRAKKKYATSNKLTSRDSYLHSRDYYSSSINKLPYLCNSNMNSEKKYLLVYTCKICKLTVDTYDRVIEHSHCHITNEEKEILRKSCNLCNLIFDLACFDSHRMLHSFNPNKNFSVLTYDAFYVTAEDNIWLNHLFGPLSIKEISDILKNSIYNFERKLKMQIIQDGMTHLTYYKCAKCSSFIEPSSLYEHCQAQLHCYQSKVVACPICGIILMSKDFLAKHEKIHDLQDVSLRSYRIVLFNCYKDKTINNTLSAPRRYVFYECRNCNGIVDKKDYENHKCDFYDLSKCSHCGLLLYSNDYMSHVVKHKEFCSFCENNIVVILVGSIRDADIRKCRLNRSFSGLTLDYLLYKCNKCQVCLGDKQTFSTHYCVNETAMTKCVTCELYFEDTQFKNHRKLHECDIYYTKENLTVIELRLRYSPASEVDTIIIEDKEDLQNIGGNNSNDKKFSDTLDSSIETVLEKHEKMYKCLCGLHFFTKASALSHYNLTKTKCNNSKRMKQTCPKCGLLFKPNILYSHLLKHHGSKNVFYKFNIIPIP